jgi:hypothetical protein
MSKNLYRNVCKETGKTPGTIIINNGRMLHRCRNGSERGYVRAYFQDCRRGGAPLMLKFLLITSIAMLMGTQQVTAEGSVSKAALDQCERKLRKCSDDCEAAGDAPSKCNKQCKTDMCPLPWTETYGAFLDRRIEDLAAQHRGPTFAGLTRLKDTQK